MDIQDQRGTVQHELLEGDDATILEEGSTIDLKINCLATGGNLSTRVPYALAVILEVSADTQLAVYAETKARVRVAVRP